MEVHVVAPPAGSLSNFFHRQTLMAHKVFVFLSFLFFLHFIPLNFIFIILHFVFAFCLIFLCRMAYH